MEDRAAIRGNKQTRIRRSRGGRKAACDQSSQEVLVASGAEGTELVCPECDNSLFGEAGLISQYALDAAHSELLGGRSECSNRSRMKLQLRTTARDLGWFKVNLLPGSQWCEQQPFLTFGKALAQARGDIAIPQDDLLLAAWFNKAASSPGCRHAGRSWWYRKGRLLRKTKQLDDCQSSKRTQHRKPAPLLRGGKLTSG